MDPAQWILCGTFLIIVTTVIVIMSVSYMRARLRARRNVNGEPPVERRNAQPAIELAPRRHSAASDQRYFGWTARVDDD